MLRAIQLGVGIARLLLWWNVQRYRWITRGEDGFYTDMNAYSRAEHDLRCRLGRLLSAFFPERTACLECGIPSGLKDDHTVWYTDGFGIGGLCRTCWNHLRQYSGGEERIVGLYRAFVDTHWGDDGRAKWPLIEAAVRAEVIHVSHSPITPRDCPECQRCADGGPYFMVRCGPLEEA